MKTDSICAMLLAVASLLGASGCPRQSADVTKAPGVAPSVATRADAPVLRARAEPDAASGLLANHVSQAPLGPSSLDAAPLPEDPEAGKRAEAQWREHLEKEEEERQVNFDRRRLKEHRALIRGINATRARVKDARSLSAFAKVEAALPAQLEQLREGIRKIDPWGVTSRLLPDYQALVTLLGGSYGEAKAEALRGDPAALAKANAEFNARVEHMKELLEEAEESEETY